MQLNTTNPSQFVFSLFCFLFYHFLLVKKVRHLGNLNSPRMYDLMSVETAIDLSEKTLQHRVHGVKMLHFFTALFKI